METWADLVIKALLEIGVISSGEEPTNDEQSDVFSRLQAMLGEWEMDGLLVPGLSNIGYDIPAGNEKLEYLIGSASLTPAPDIVLEGSINTLYTLNYRPQFRDYARPLQQTSYLVLSENRRSTVVTPTMFYFDVSYPYARILFNRTPEPRDRFEITYRGSFGDIQLANQITDTVPSQYSEPIMLNLAVKIAPSFGIKEGRDSGLSAVTVSGAISGKRMIRKRNWKNPISRLDPSLLNYGDNMVSAAYGSRRW